MRSPNLSLGRRKHLNLIIKHTPESPLFLFPTVYFIPVHDVNLEIEGFAFGFCFLRTSAQINFRRSSWPKKPAAVDLTKANSLSSKMSEIYGNSPDAIAIVNTFERNRWLRELTSRGVDESHYGLRIIREAAKDSGSRREDGPGANAKGNSTEIRIEGLD